MTRPPPLQHRIMGVLLLQPMTAVELGRCLTRCENWIRQALYRLQESGMVEVCDRRKRRAGQASPVYRLKHYAYPKEKPR